MNLNLKLVWTIYEFWIALAKLNFKVSATVVFEFYVILSLLGQPRPLTMKSHLQVFSCVCIEIQKVEENKVKGSMLNLT